MSTIDDAASSKVPAEGRPQGEARSLSRIRMAGLRGTAWTFAIAAPLAAALIGCSPPEGSDRKAASVPPPAAAPAKAPEASQARQWDASDKTPRQIGSFDAASGSLIAKPGQSGYLVAGPYVRLPAGRYKVTFLLDADAAVGSASPGAVDVNAFSAANLSTVIATKPIESKSGPNVVELEFEAGDAGVAYEFRVLSSGKSRLAYRTARLASIGP